MSGARPQVIAVFGGSFDPPHVAHALVACYVLSTVRVDRFLVVPTARHPFDKQLSPFEHRHRMCELAMAHLKNVEVSSIEAELGGESLTLRTLKALKERMPTVQLRLVIGSDLLPGTRDWHNFPAVEALAPPIIVQRVGHETDHARPALPAVSSTEVRRRVRAGEPLTGLVSPAVAEYIDTHQLYG